MTMTIHRSPRAVAEGALVRRHREAAGLSQEEVATLIGYSKPLIGHIENGKRNLNHRTKKALTEALRITQQAWTELEEQLND